jgi:hypothetical protein
VQESSREEIVLTSEGLMYFGGGKRAAQVVKGRDVESCGAESLRQDLGLTTLDDGDAVERPENTTGQNNARIDDVSGNANSVVKSTDDNYSVGDTDFSSGERKSFNDKYGAYIERTTSRRSSSADEGMYTNQGSSSSGSGSRSVSPEFAVDDDTKKFLEELPDEVKCPLGGGVMSDPWIAADGYSYEVIDIHM